MSFTRYAGLLLKERRGPLREPGALMLDLAPLRRVLVLADASELDPQRDK